MFPDHLVYLPALGQTTAVGRRIGGTHAPPHTAVVLAHTLRYRGLRTLTRHTTAACKYAGPIVSSVRLDVQSALGEVVIPNAGLIRVGEIRQHGVGIEDAWHGLVNIDAGQLAEQLEDIDLVHHGVHGAVRLHDDRSG